MNKVFFVSSDNINAQTGAAKFARLLLSKPELWERNGYELSSYTNSDTFSDETDYRKTFQHKAKQSIKAILGKTRVGKRIRFFDYHIRVLGAKPIASLKPCISKASCVILNDLKVAWNFYKEFGTEYKTIFIMHNSGELLSMMHEEMKEIRIRRFLENSESEILKNADRIVFVSEVARNRFIAKHPEYSAKTVTIYIGMDEGYSHIAHEDPSIRFVTVGSVCDRKNQILAIQAVERLKEENISLTVVGGGPALKECQEYVRTHNLEDKVFFTGATNQVGEILRRSDVFLMTSKDEGLPVAAQEAMSAGLPLILTDVGGCSELIQNNGILIHPVLGEVIDAMRLFIEKPEMVGVYEEESRSLFQKRFSLEKMQEGYIDLVQEVSTE